MWPKYLDIDAKTCAGILRKLGKLIEIYFNLFINPYKLLSF